MTIATIEHPAQSPLPFLRSGRPLLPELLDRAIRAIVDATNFGGFYRQRIALNRHQTSNGDAPGFVRYGLPYTLEPLPGDRSILLNRDYKPVGLGIPYGLWVDYEAFPQWHVAGDALARVTAAECWLRSERDGYDTHPSRFMFHDLCAPWGGAKVLREYMDRLYHLRQALAP